MKKTYFIIFLFFFFFLHTINAQIKMKGIVQTNENGKLMPLSFIPIILSKASDTLTIYKSTLTDVNGEYLLEDVKIGAYRINISSIGYTAIDENIRVVFPSSGRFYTKNYILKQQVILLDEITVNSSATKQTLDKTTYTITKKDLANAVNAIDLLDKIPQLSFDDATRKIKSSFGGTIKFLINGVNASEQELMTLTPDQIKSIEYYDFPPARYAGFSNVINVITKYFNDGFYGGAYMESAFTTGFINTNLFLKYNWGKNQFSVNGSNGYRNYKNVSIESDLNYSINGVDYEREEDYNRKFGYSDNYIDLTYTRNVEDKYILQINLSPDFMYIHENENINIEQTIDDLLEQRIQYSNKNDTIFTPSLDIYSSINLPKKQTLIINAVGTYSKATQKYNVNEYLTESDNLVFSDKNDLNNTKKSIIAEVNYVKQFNNINITVGSKVNYGVLDSYAEKIESSNLYETNTISNYSYVEVMGKIKNKFSYRASLGANYYKNRSDSIVNNSLTFTPNVMLSYVFNDIFSLRTAYKRSTRAPTLSQLSNNSILMTEGIIMEGNPYLKSSKENLYALIFGAKYKWFDSQLVGFYGIGKNVINNYFVDSDSYISLKPENMDFFDNIGLRYSFNISPFKNNLIVLKVYGSLIYTTIDSSIERYSHLNYPVNYQIDFNYKNFSLSYQGNIVSSKLSGPYLSYGDKLSTLQFRYKYKNWSFAASCLWFLTSPETSSKTIDGSLVSSEVVQCIMDNQNMVTLGVSYYFNVGKQYKGKNKNKNNKDNDTGLF